MKQLELRFDAWRRDIARIAALIGVGSLISCGDGSFHTYSVGGSAVGLAGIGLVMQANGTDNLAVSKDGTFSFSTHLADGSAYKITVLAQPSNPIQNCVVMNGTDTGTLLHASVTSITVRCANVGRFAYTNNVGSYGVSGGSPPTFISGYLIDAVSGALRPAYGGPLGSGVVWAQSLAIDPLGRFAFIARQFPDFDSRVNSLVIDRLTRRRLCQLRPCPG